jgi:hypothetical protein
MSVPCPSSQCPSCEQVLLFVGATRGVTLLVDYIPLEATAYDDVPPKARHWPDPIYFSPEKQSVTASSTWFSFSFEIAADTWLYLVNDFSFTAHN